MFPRFCFWHLLLKDERAVQLIGLSAGAAPLCHPSSGGHRLKKATAINDVAKEAEAAVHLRGRPLVADARHAGRDQLVDPFAALCSPRRDGPGPRAISVRSLKRPPASRPPAAAPASDTVQLTRHARRRVSHAPPRRVAPSTRIVKSWPNSALGY